jgi:hypothetical protein
MDAILIKSLVALVPACVLFSGSVVLFSREKTVFSFLQLLGSGCLVVVVLTHVCEALHLFPWMHWGLEHSVGQYLDLWSAVLGLTLFPIGYLLHALYNAARLTTALGLGAFEHTKAPTAICRFTVCLSLIRSVARMRQPLNSVPRARLATPDALHRHLGWRSPTQR